MASVRRLPPLICLLLIAVSASACGDSGPAGPSVGLNESFTLAPGEVAVVGDDTLRVQFERVSGDNRCPADVVCILGGDAIVHVRVFGSGGVGEYELHTGDDSLASVTHGSVRLTLESLEPFPFSSGPPIEPGDYRATFTAESA